MVASGTRKWTEKGDLRETMRTTMKTGMTLEFNSVSSGIGKKKKGSSFLWTGL